MTIDRKTLVGRIRALQAKASNRASTEAEIETAMRMASRLIIENEISEDELREKGVSGMTSRAFCYRTKTPPLVLRETRSAILRLTQTTRWISKSGMDYAGEPADVEFAVYLSQLLVESAERCWQSYRRTLPVTDRSSLYYLRRGFEVGFSRRMSERMNQLADEREGFRSTGTDLVVLKKELLRRFVEDELGVVFRNMKAPQTRFSRQTVQAGRDAAESLNLNRPLSPGEEASLIS